jgi:hypothetical protein
MLLIYRLSFSYPEPSPNCSNLTFLEKKVLYVLTWYETYDTTAYNKFLSFISRTFQQAQVLVPLTSSHVESANFVEKEIM